MPELGILNTPAEVEITDKRIDDTGKHRHATTAQRSARVNLVSEWADSLRVLGRDGAHPEFPELTPDDAEDGVKLLREIVKYVYILPHERAEK